MYSGSIPLDTISGGFDLQQTLESGQSYLWSRRDGEMYADHSTGDEWYELTTAGSYLRVRLHDGDVEWEATTAAEDVVRDRLRLDDDLETIYATLPHDPLISRSIEQYPGMRLVRDPSFPCLISFICSAQMRVERIHRMQSALARAFGESLDIDGERRHAFPTPAQLAGATEPELRELGLGFRAPYVLETARMVEAGEDPAAATSLPYEDARAYLTRYTGVGLKVADCVLLFSLGFLEAVPLDTWIRKAIDRAYPDCDRGGYVETSRAIRERFGGQYAGYAQTYVFHYLRTRDEWERAVPSP